MCRARQAFWNGRTRCKIGNGEKGWPGKGVFRPPAPEQVDQKPKGWEKEVWEMHCHREGHVFPVVRDLWDEKGLWADSVRDCDWVTLRLLTFFL